MIPDETAKELLAEIHAALLLSASSPDWTEKTRDLQGRVTGLVSAITLDDDERKLINSECARKGIGNLRKLMDAIGIDSFVGDRAQTFEEIVAIAASRGVDYRSLLKE